MKRISNLIVFLLWSVLIWAGQEVTGRVVDNTTRQPIDFANVTIMQSGQNVPVGGTVTDATGHFSIELSQGSYEIIVSFMGYTEERIAIQVHDKDVTLGRILLKEDTQALEEVEVVAQHSISFVIFVISFFFFFV